MVTPNTVVRCKVCYRRFDIATRKKTSFNAGWICSKRCFKRHWRTRHGKEA